MIRIRDRLLLMAFGALFIALGIYTVFMYIAENRFISGGFSEWIEIDATIDDYRAVITDCVKSGKNYVYNIRYEYTFSFDTDKGRVSCETSIESREMRDDPNLSEETFRNLMTWSATTISYNPEDPEDNRWGSKDGIIENATNPLRFLICGALVVGGAIVLWLAVRPLLNQKSKESWHGTEIQPEEPGRDEDQ